MPKGVAEDNRIKDLREYGILDTPPETEFDALTFLASQICGVPIALVSFVDEERVWFKSKIGMMASEMPRTQSFCHEAIQQNEMLVVEDVLKDGRFKSLPVVQQSPHVRFYAGTPLISPQGQTLGTLCVLDIKPRLLTQSQLRTLQELNHLVISQLELRRTVVKLRNIAIDKERIDDELKKSQRDYKSIIDSANELIYRTDSHGLITFFNPAATRLLQYDPDELNGRHFLELVSPPYRKSVEKFYGVQRRKQIPTTYREVPALAKDGSVVWLGQSVHLNLQDELLMGFSVVARNITEKKAVEEQVSESERRLLTIINSVSEGITLSDESGFYEVFNPRMEELTGYSWKEANEVPDFLKLIYPNDEDYRRVNSIHKESFATYEMQESEITIRTKSGEKKILTMSSCTVEHNHRRMMLGVYRDITERKRIDQAIQISEKRFRTFFESNPIPTWVFDLETLQFLEVNNAALDHYGYSKEEFLGMTTMDIRPEDDLSNLEKSLEAIRTGESSAALGKHRRKDGSIIDVSLLWHDFEYEGRRAVLVVAQDITESKRVQEELRQAKEIAEIANRAKSEFLANMSHEIRTPMNGVIGTIDLLSGTPLSPEQREYVETIRLSGDALLNVINDILDYSKIESHEIELEEHPFRIETCIEEIFELFAIQADQKNIDLVYWIDASVPHMVRVDVTRLRQVIVNLVSNAMKFTTQGEIQIGVSKISERDGQIELLFSVRDTGIGISADRIHKLFRPFSQIDSSSTRKFGGTGLGLAICGRAVELLGGHIWVESKVSEGSTFQFSIKVSEHLDTQKNQNLCPPLVDSTKKALIINDNPVCRHILEDLFIEWGFTVRSVETCERSIDLFKGGERFEVVVAEQVPYDESTVRLQQIIRKENENEKSAIIVVASRLNRSKILQENSEALHVVLKPVRHRLLYETVAAVLKPPSGLPSLTASGGAQPPKQPAIPPMMVLIAEDNTINQKLIVRILKIIGQEPEVVSNGLEAVNAIRKKKYDIVLMDIQMPEMDGYESTRQIRQTVPAEQQPIIIAMTAHSLQGDREKCLNAGMDDYMSKPILIDEVRRIIQKWYENIQNRN